MTNQILVEFKEILGKIKSKPHSDSAKDALNYLEKCFDSSIPTHKISLLGLSRYKFYFNHLLEKDRERYTELIKQVEKTLYDKGYRPASDFLNYQEHLLIGSSMFEEEKKKCIKNPYLCVGIIDKKINVQEAKKARDLVKTVKAIPLYFCLDTHDFVNISLEPLDNKGNTIRDPSLINDKMRLLPTKYSKDFPFRRSDNFYFNKK